SSVFDGLLGCAYAFAGGRRYAAVGGGRRGRGHFAHVAGAIDGDGAAVRGHVGAGCGVELRDRGQDGRLLAADDAAFEDFDRDRALELEGVTRLVEFDLVLLAILLD